MKACLRNVCYSVHNFEGRKILFLSTVKLVRVFLLSISEIRGIFSSFRYFLIRFSSDTNFDISFVRSKHVFETFIIRFIISRRKKNCILSSGKIVHVFLLSISDRFEEYSTPCLFLLIFSYSIMI